MGRKREVLSPDDLIEVSKHGVKRFVRYDEGRQLYSMGRNRFIELAKKADSRYKECGVVLCDTDKINEYIVANCKIEDDLDDGENNSFLRNVDKD